MLKKILIVLGAVVALLLLFLGAVLAIGARQPADHVATSRATFAAAPADVWARVVDFEHWPDWNHAFDSATREADEGGKPRWSFHGSFGPMPIVVDERIDGARLVTRIPADAGVGFTGTWTYTIAPSGAGTTLTITEAAHVDSLLFRGIGALFMDPHDTMNGVLVDLGKSFGEDVEPREVASE